MCQQCGASSGLTIVHYTHSVTRPGLSISSQHQRSPDSSRSCSSPRPGRSSPTSQGSWTGRAVFTCTRSSRTFGAPQSVQWAGPRNRRAGRAACYTGAAFMCSNLRLMLWPHTPQLLLALFSNSNMCIAECSPDNVHKISTLGQISPACWCSCLVAAGCTL